MLERFKKVPLALKLWEALAGLTITAVCFTLGGMFGGWVWWAIAIVMFAILVAIVVRWLQRKGIGVPW